MVLLKQQAERLLFPGLLGKEGITRYETLKLFFAVGAKVQYDFLRISIFNKKYNVCNYRNNT